MRGVKGVGGGEGKEGGGGGCTLRGPWGVSTAQRSYSAIATSMTQVVHSGMKVKV